MKNFLFAIFVLFGLNTLLYSQTYFTDNFDSNDDLSNWYVANGADSIGTSIKWDIIPEIAYSNPNSAYIYYDSLPVGQLAKDWLVSSEIDLTSATNPQLSFYSTQLYEEEYNSVYKVMVSATSQTDQSTFTEVASWDESTLGPHALFTQKLVNLKAYAGKQIYIAFLFINNQGDCWFIDDVVVKESAANDMVFSNAALNRYIYSNQDNIIELTIQNNGANEITSLTVNWNDGTNHESVITTSVASCAAVTLQHPIPVKYSDNQEHNIVVSITAVNGQAILAPTNTVTLITNTISKNGNRKIVYEEGTGTWCGYCPSGEIAFKHLLQKYPGQLIPIAVHANDIMGMPEYISAAAYTGFPSFNINRKFNDIYAVISTLEAKHALAIQELTPVDIKVNTALLGQNLTVEAAATFYSNFTEGDFRFAIVLSEEEVKGSTPDYDQTNYYAGGGYGAMGGYENLPNPVPASQMVYNHVAREMIGGYNGVEGSIPASISLDSPINYTFNHAILPGWNLDKTYGTIFVIDNTSGFIMNALQFPVKPLGIDNDIVSSEKDLFVYPNPTNDLIKIKIAETGKYRITIYNTLGQVVLSEKEQNMLKGEEFPFSVSSLKQGSYIIALESNERSYSKRIIIK